MGSSSPDQAGGACGASPSRAQGPAGDLRSPALQDRSIAFGCAPGIGHMPHRADLPRCLRLRDKPLGLLASLGRPTGHAGPHRALNALGTLGPAATDLPAQPSARGGQRTQGEGGAVNHSSAWRSRPETPFRSRLQAQDQTTYAIALLCVRRNQPNRRAPGPRNELPPLIR
jgi:hypothetical protein